MRGKFGRTNTYGTFCFKHLVENWGEAPVSEIIQLDSAHDCDQCKWTVARAETLRCLDAFLEATRALRVAWDADKDWDPDAYPKGLPSFDEFHHAVAAWRTTEQEAWLDE
jgi:hypothetical protein